MKNEYLNEYANEYANEYMNENANENEGDRSCQSFQASTITLVPTWL